MLKLACLMCLVGVVAGIPVSSHDMQSFREAEGDWRVVGGSDAPAGAYPFMVSLRGPAANHFCGGTILNQMNILTAAHCVYGRSTADISIVAGTNTLNSGGTTRDPRRFIVHSDYNSDTYVTDVAVIRLTSDLSTTNLIQQVSLNTDNTGAVASILIGWGRTYTDGSAANNLQHLTTNTLTHAQCVLWWSSLVSNNQICAVIAYGRGACNGDSGGPLIQTSSRAQIGIASFIRTGGCAQGYPDVYTRVSSYMPWIISAVYS